MNPADDELGGDAAERHLILQAVLDDEVVLDEQFQTLNGSLEIIEALLEEVNGLEGLLGPDLDLQELHIEVDEGTQTQLLLLRLRDAVQLLLALLTRELQHALRHFGTELGVASGNQVEEDEGGQSAFFESLLV